MNRSRFRVSMFLALAGCLAATAPALALRPCVLDGGDVFDPATIARVNETIRAIKNQSGRDLMVETYPSIPAELQAEFERKGKDRFYSDWVAQRARALGVNGIFILVCMQPRHLEVGVGDVTRKKLFTDADRAELVKQLTNDFKTSRFDAGLVRGVEFVQARLRANAGGEPATKPSEGGSDFGHGDGTATGGSDTRPTSGPGTEPRRDTPGGPEIEKGSKPLSPPEPGSEVTPAPQRGSDVPPQPRDAPEREKSAERGLESKALRLL